VVRRGSEPEKEAFDRKPLEQALESLAADLRHPEKTLPHRCRNILDRTARHRESASR